MTPLIEPPQVVEEIVHRAGRPDFQRWSEQLHHCGHCSRPVRLRGRVLHQSTSGRRSAYSTDGEPDGVLMIRCGNRRAAVCPSCSWEYAGDMWQLLYAGTAGGRKGVPDSIRSHPLVFTTLTAPGFGPVHTTRADRSGPARCHPPQDKPQPCPHGRPTWCTAVHTEGDPRLGQPICPDCYDYPAHIAFNWHAPELWRRFTITLRRVLARRAGLTTKDFTGQCRLSFVKVAEFQRRAVVHFHALIRLDGPGTDFGPPCVNLDVDNLADAIREAVGLVRLTVDMPDGTGLELRFGEQTDTQPISGGPAGELTAERAAAYIAKYATKSADDFGLGDRRITLETLPLLGVSDHVTRIIQTCWQLGEHKPYDGLHRWLHMLGFRGHFASKSRRYSTTLGAIRGERRAYRQRQTVEHVRELLDEDTTLVVSHWEFTGVGYLTTGDTALALSEAARARERRQAARDAA
ncbi:MAG: replication initiation protein [Pseudonocardiales bacterium]|nr:replication initiation protein [Pseudonocardiales bacterium]MBV9032791.1 replication initiation protein [Pseudonocardiales bacterium]MBW0011195.1 replication initiation protein [Pseudonocardiales bacterium]